MRFILIFLALAFSASCVKTLNVKVSNPDKASYILRVSVREEGKAPTLNDIGTIGANQDQTVSEKFSNNSNVKIQARQANYVVWESPDYRLDRDRSDIVTIDTSHIRRVDPEGSAKELMETDKKFKELIPVKGYRPLINVLETDFGSFVVRRKDSTEDWRTIVAPGHYGGVKDLNWVKANVGSSSARIQQTVLLNRTTTAQVSGGVALFEAKAGYTDQDLYEYGVNIDIMTLKHNDTFASAKAKLALATSDVAKSVNAELDRYLADQRYVVAFVRSVHYFNDYVISYRKASKVSVDATLQGGTLFDSSGAYQLESIGASTNAYKDQVGGFFFEQVDDVIDKSKPAAPADGDVKKVLGDFVGVPRLVPIGGKYFFTRDTRDVTPTKRDSDLDSYLLSPTRRR
ncbi:hypothetical protein [Pyxidicoccus caerfyrddinensis]|uniref:hypothetical protein n=1 Tax=Pyxidicoccus caerfyrddinensis TaxID=2709663 RepID=UPI0013DC17DF|nr:hypothetical protein [Pyxidicoccus caerfyrddinensis]